MKTGQIPNRDLASVEEIAQAKKHIADEVGKVIIGQDDVIELLLIALFSRGHCIFVGVPGLAKTLLVSTLAQALDLCFQRIQFTPDLMPSDIVGTDILQEDHTTGKRFFHFVKGPVFCNLLLADEINRTSPKTQAALLQAMQEYKVTAGGQTFDLTRPFLVFATQNPIEQEGTYPLPEAQLDRFMFHIDVDYPSAAEEVTIVESTTSAYEPDVKPILGPEKIVELQELVRRVPASDHVVKYAVNLARRTRPEHEKAPDFIKEWVAWGAGPRAAQYLTLAAKARAVLHSRYAATCEDVREVLLPVLKHRVLTNFRAEAEGVASNDIVAKLVDTVKEDEELS